MKESIQYDNGSKILLASADPAPIRGRSADVIIFDDRIDFGLDKDQSRESLVTAQAGKCFIQVLKMREKPLLQRVLRYLDGWLWTDEDRSGHPAWAKRLHGRLGYYDWPLLDFSWKPSGSVTDKHVFQGVDGTWYCRTTETELDFAKVHEDMVRDISKQLGIPAAFIHSSPPCRSSLTSARAYLNSITGSRPTPGSSSSP